MSKRFLLIAVSAFLCSFCFSQKQGYNWCFGDSCGIHFTDSSVTPFVSALSFDSTFLLTIESSAAISDKNGNLLFYSNGSMVWNKNHELMPNGTGLYSNTSITQGSIILPVPDDSIHYFLFHMNNVAPHKGFFYSIIDMSANQGLGDVESTKKNVLLDSTYVGEKLAAVRHANGRDWWVVHRERNTKKYYIYLVTPDTIRLSNIQNLGGYVSIFVEAGQMNFSQDGSKLCLVAEMGDINLLDFNRCTSTLSNLIDLSDSSPVFYYGSSFSADGSKLYVSTSQRLYQFDLTAANILQSKQLIWTNPYFDSILVGQGFSIAQHQLAPDNKIYVVVCANDPLANIDTFINENLCVINDPNQLGAACDFSPFIFNLAGHHNSAGLPNMPNYNLSALAGSPCDTLVNAIAEINDDVGFNIYPNPANEFITISFSSKNNLPVQLIIQNALGDIVYEEKTACLAAGKSSSQKAIDVSALLSGVYLIEIKTKEESAVRKFVKE